ncbi:hypothetical protein BGX30_006901 [Mortierella sp. GBA39]|nr:hypothetical protein BGX30_006901 [Mortierella sp. GBA39]
MSMSRPLLAREGAEYDVELWQRQMESSITAAAAQRWYFTDMSKEGTTNPVEPATIRAIPSKVWTNKASLKDVPPGWYWVVFCVSFDGLDLDQITTMHFDAERGDALNNMGTLTNSCKTRLTTHEIKHNLKQKASMGMVRLRMHRQIEVTGKEEYLHLCVAAKSRSTFQPSEIPLFKLHYVELGTSSFRSATGEEDYVLYGFGNPDQVITVDRGPSSPERPTATKIRTFGISDKGEFAVTLHLRESNASPASPTTSNTGATVITVDAATSTATLDNPPSSTVPTIDGRRPRVHAVISVWDIRSSTNSIDVDVKACPDWGPLQYSLPCAEIDNELPDMLASPEAWKRFHACISISTKGTKVALCGIETTYGALPFVAYDNLPAYADQVREPRTFTKRPTCKGLELFSGHCVFHRIDPDQFDHHDDNNDNERFITFNGSVFEVYSTKSSGWIRLHRITLTLDLSLNRPHFYVFVQSLRGRYFAWTGVPGVVSIWNIEKAKLVKNIYVDIDTSPIHAVLSPDGSKVAISVKGSVQIYQSTTGILLGTHTKSVLSDNNSEVVLGDEYFVVKDKSHAFPGGPVDVRSIVRIQDMKVVYPEHPIHPDYRLVYPLPSTTTIAAYKQGSVLNIKRMTAIESPSLPHPCRNTPCELEEVPIDDFIDKKIFTYAGGVFEVKCFQEYLNGYMNMMLKVTVRESSNDSPATVPKSMVLPLGDTTAGFRGHYLPMTSKLVVFAEGYMKIWSLSSTAAHVCQLDYVWGSLPYQPENAKSYCYRPLLKAWSCRHGASLKYRLGKPVWYEHNVAKGNTESTERDILTVPPNRDVESVTTSEGQRLKYGIFSLIDIYGYKDLSCKQDIIRYLLTCIRPSTINPTSCLVPLCQAWSLKNQAYIFAIMQEILPETMVTWIPDSTATETTDPLAILMNIAKKERSVIKVVRVVIGYCVAQATRFNNMAFLHPLFGSMREIIKYYPEEALKYMGRIAFFRVKYPSYLWENHIPSQKLTPLRFSLFKSIRRIGMSELEIKRGARLESIMQFKYNMETKDCEGGDGSGDPVFMASFDALWYNKSRDVDREEDRIFASNGRRHRSGERGTNGSGSIGGGSDAQLTPHNSMAASDMFGEPLKSEKTTKWKALLQMVQLKLLFRAPPVVECYNFELELFDNPAIAALVSYKWDTIGYPYWFVRFFCQFFYYMLVVTAALTQVYNPRPSRLYGVFIAIIAMAFIFIMLEIMQAVQDWKRYLRSHYNIADVAAFGIPLAASIQQLVLIYGQKESSNNRALSFSVLVVFFHMLIELRISKGVCKYVTIIQQAVVEIWIFFMIFAGCIVAFTITLLHLRMSCTYEGCTRTETKYPRHFVGALSATYFFLGGRYDPVSGELDSMEDWAFHLAMFIFLFSTTILMLNVLIALINVAFAKGDDSWRLAWIEARLRYIESAENLSYHIPGFRQTFDCFPKLIYFTATAKDVNAYINKYPKGQRQDDIESLIDEWVKPERYYHSSQDGSDEEKDKDVRKMPDASPKVEHLPLNSYDSRTSAGPSYWPPNSGTQGSDSGAGVGVGVGGGVSGHLRQYDSSSGGSDGGRGYVYNQQQSTSITSSLYKPGDPGPSSSPQPMQPTAVVVPTLVVATEERVKDTEALMDPEVLSATVHSLDRRMIILSEQAGRIEQALMALSSSRSDNSTAVGAGSSLSLSSPL